MSDTSDNTLLSDADSCSRSVYMSFVGVSSLRLEVVAPLPLLLGQSLWLERWCVLEPHALHLLLCVFSRLLPLSIVSYGTQKTVTR